MYRKGSLFVAHIIKEGQIAYDDGYYMRLSKEKFMLSKYDLDQTLLILRQRLSISDDLKRYNNYYITCLADFFAISRKLAILALAYNGKLQFDKDKAFQEFSQLYPKQRKRISELRALQPFFLRSEKGFDVPKPFEPKDESEIIHLREDVKEVLNEVMENAK
jgi:hypothetical protein